MSLDPVLQIFFDEADEMLRTFEEGVLGLEATPDDPELLNSIFRAAHTLKGNSSMLGFERIATVTHTLEDLLSRLRTGHIAPSPAIVNTLLAAGDALRALIAQARARQGAPDTGEDDVADLGALVDALADHAQSLGGLVSEREPGVKRGWPIRDARGSDSPGQPFDPRSATAPAGSRPRSRRRLYEIRFAPPADIFRRGLDPLRLLDGVAALGELIRVQVDTSALPPLAELSPEESYFAFTAWLMSGEPREEVAACFDFVDDPDAVRIEALEMDDEEGDDATPVAPAREMLPALARSALDADRTRAVAAPAADIASIRVATEKVDRLVDLVGELVITQSMVAQIVDKFSADRLGELAEAVAQMDRHARDLQERVMAVRMLPIRTVFGRFSRVVRDLAQSQGKRVTLRVDGEETELDKTVIERIGDPLMHLVRNAVDHGIETPAARREAGKPETGSLALLAYQQGGSIYVEITDDGRGLDRERILAKAVESGLVAAGDTLTDDQVHALIFQPGFSTAREVTEVSGRGVGMDVVKRNVEALGGTIGIHSVPGRGTTFRIKLPLTLAILEGQSLRVGSEVYVLPLATITESVRPTADTLKPVLGAGEAFLMRGEILPFVRLHRVFDVSDAVEDPLRGLTVVVEHDGRRVALMVDELLGQQQVVIKSLDTHFHRVEGVAGATILGDGKVALILDVPGLVALGKAA